MGRSIAGTVLTVLLVVVVVSLLAGQLLGQPVLLGYVATDSMEPSLSPGDGFVVIPSFVAGPADPGDVVTFEARELHGGGLTTHRIVEKTESGYVTKGDANPFTDQDGGEPPVNEGQIVAQVLTIHGDPVAIPYLGTAVTTVRGVVTYPFQQLSAGQASSGMVVIGILLFVLAGVFGEEEQRRTTRSRERPNVVAIWTVVLFAVLVVVGAATAAMVLPAGVQEFGVRTTENPTSNPQVVEPGGTATVEYEIPNGGVLPVVVVSDPASPGLDVEPRRAVLQGGQSVQSTVTMTAPDEAGTYLRHVQRSRYLLVLPVDVLVGLHRIHPVVALLAVDVVVATFVVALAVGVFGTDDLRLRSGPDHVPRSVRLRRRLRRWL